MSLVSGRNLEQDLPKIVAELQGFTISLLTGAGAAAPIAVTGIETEDTIVKAIAFGGAGSPDGVGMEDITSQASIADRRAKGTLTVGVVADGDAVSVNGKTYTFTEAVESITYNAAPNVVPIETDPSGAVDEDAIALRLAQVIMSNDSSLTCTVAGAVVTVWNRVAGTIGNGKTLTVSASGGHVTRGATTLLGGTATASVAFTGSTVGLAILLFWFNKTP